MACAEHESLDKCDVDILSDVSEPLHPLRFAACDIVRCLTLQGSAQDTCDANTQD